MANPRNLVDIAPLVSASSTGNLGIGTTSPVTKLHVEDSSTVVRIAGASGTVPQLQLSSSGVVNWSMRANFQAASDFTIYQDSTQRLIIDSSGNVGIGTSSPGVKLDVQGTAGVIQLKQTTAGSATYYVMDTTVEAGGKRWRFGYTGGLGAAASTFSLFNQTDNITSWIADASGNLGLGVTPSYKLDMHGASGLGIQIYETSTGNANRLQITQSAGLAIYNTTYGNGSTNAHVWQIAAIEHMRLNSSGNLGIGTSSPATKLHIDVTGITDNTVSEVARFQGTVSGGSTNTHLRISSAVSTGGTAGRNIRIGVYDHVAASRNLVLQPDGGNLGLGVTPSAWTSYVVQDINTRGLGIAGGNDSGEITVNAYYDAPNWKYKGTSSYGVTRYNQFNGAHAWYTAPSGTQGNTISFGDPKMTLDVNGNLGVGETSPAARLHIKTGEANLATFSTTRASGSYITLNIGASGASLGYFGSAGHIVSSGVIADLALRAESNLVFSAGGTGERARITSSGSLLIGTTSASGGLMTVNGALNIINDSGAYPSQTGGIIFAKPVGRNYSNSDGVTSFTIRLSNSGSGEFYAKITVVGLNPYQGSGYFRYQTEVVGYMSDTSMTVISESELPNQSMVFSTPTKAANQVNIAVTTGGNTNYRFIVNAEIHALSIATEWTLSIV